MNILTISGSMRPDSSNVWLLNFIGKHFKKHSFFLFDISSIPMFDPRMLQAELPAQVMEWKKAVINSDAIIITTPEYIFNIPAQLKSALEWFAASGELVGKRTLPITFTPHPPRGEKAMQSLLWCLQALDANVITSLELHKTEITFDNDGLVEDRDGLEMLEGAIQLLEN